MNKRSGITTLVILALALVMTIMMTNHAMAIPAFARKYQMSCTTCHAPVPRLKAYGDEFAGNGFVLKDKDSPRYFVNTGDDNLSLIRALPIAIRMDGFIKHESVTEKDVDFTTPYNLKVLSGGSLGKNIAYYFYFFMSERGEVAGVEDAYIMFNNMFGHDFDIYVGQFQVSDPLFKREVRLTYEDYQIYRTTPGMSGINLTYDRGLMFTLGLPSGTDIIAEITNGNGIGEALEHRVYDNDKYKSIIGRVSQEVNEAVRVGLFGYYGKEEGDAYLLDGDLSEDYLTATNEVWYLGCDATVSHGPLELNLQYLKRQDDNPQFLEEPLVGDEYSTKGGFAELIVWPNGDQSKWYAAGLYNKVTSDWTEAEYESISGQVGYIMMTNLRLFFENTYFIDSEENRALVGFVAGF